MSGGAQAACSRNNIEAVNLANEADKQRESNRRRHRDLEIRASGRQLDPTNFRILWKLATDLPEKRKLGEGQRHARARSHQALAPDARRLSFGLQGLCSRAAGGEKGPTSWADAKEPLEQAIKSSTPITPTPHFDLTRTFSYHLDDEKGALDNYTKAIMAQPDKLAFYGPLADLYIRLGFYDVADQVLSASMAYKKEGDIAMFNIYSLQGEIKEIRGDNAGSIKNYEDARNSCGQCNDKGEQIAYFNLGAAYAKANPPRKSESIQQLTKFNKTVCKGAAAKRFEDECTQTADIVRQMAEPFSWRYFAGEHGRRSRPSAWSHSASGAHGPKPAALRFSFRPAHLARAFRPGGLPGFLLWPLGFLQAGHWLFGDRLICQTILKATVLCKRAASRAA